MSIIGCTIRRSVSATLRPLIVKDIAKYSELDKEVISKRLENFSEAIWINTPGVYMKKLFKCWGHCFKSWYHAKKHDHENMEFHADEATKLAKNFEDAYHAAMSGASVEEIRNIYNALAIQQSKKKRTLHPFLFCLYPMYSSFL